MSKGYALFPNILQRTVWVPIRLLLWFFVRLQVHGLENLSSIERGAIFSPNHTSEWDAITLTVSLPFFSHFFPMFFISRGKDFYTKSGWRQAFYGGRLFATLGGIPAVKGHENYEVTLKQHAAVLMDGKSLCVFPEGRISTDENLQKGHGGVGYLAWRTGRLVIPVAIRGAWKMTIGDFLLRKRRVSIRFGVPMRSQTLFSFCGNRPVVAQKRNDFRVAAEATMTKIRDLLNSPE